MVRFILFGSFSFSAYFHLRKDFPFGNIQVVLKHGIYVSNQIIIYGLIKEIRH